MIFQPGDYITGRDRSFTRSIYQYLGTEILTKENVGDTVGVLAYLEGVQCAKLRFKGLARDNVFPGWTDDGRFPNSFRWEPVELVEAWPRTVEQEFRLATSQELAEIGIVPPTD